VDDIAHFAMVIGLTAVAVLAAVSSNRLTELIRIPAPALFLVAAAVAADLWPVLGTVPVLTDERLVTVALIFILFDGGMHIGWAKFRASAGAITWLGVVGTAVTAVGMAAAAHFLFGLAWQPALLIGTALAPTDPAVVFSVLGGREVEGRSGTILEGESGANDPVGIAVMVALLGSTGAGSAAVWEGLGEFARQIGVGGLVGGLTGWLLIRLFRWHLPNEALYPVRAIAAAAAIYGLAGVLGGSGFLAVLLAGIIVGDTRAPYKREVERFASGMSSLAEIVAFVVLGLTISLPDVLDPDVWVPGLILALILIFLVRPVFVGLLTLPLALTWGERIFVLWSGLKGAVPILLGAFVLSAGVPSAERIYGVIFVVVLVSVLLQGSLVPSVAKWCKVPMRLVAPEPWSLGMRFRDEPRGLQRLEVQRGSAADGSPIGELDIGEDGWVSLVGRGGRLVAVNGSTVLEAGDDVLLLVPEDRDLRDVFGGPAPPTIDDA
jgi:cell volume regulation protein A